MPFIEEEWTSHIKLKVRWGDMDAFNHVNNTIYFRYMETARIQYFRDVEWGTEEDSLAGPILAHTSCQFLHPVVYPDTLTVALRAKKIGNSSIVHEYAIFTEKLGLAAKGDSVVVCFDYDKNSKVTIPDELRERIKEREVLDL